MLHFHRLLQMIKSRENFCLLNVLKSSYSRTCLRENVCKFLFHCYTYAHVASVQGVWCTVRVQRSFPCDEDHGITLNTRMEYGRER
ncbi:hypothetical protein T01_12762 [Trichinella spiralis]|uniref:Uncharacterized protein n=1 Tax=Trichinella spiralis TaxID=6334 RepID=A0A0V1AT98_TRISP|nr:hypothetical protein T01_12762 [Trichinella spiralis]